jgi:hypothetical protein
MGGLIGGGKVPEPAPAPAPPPPVEAPLPPDADDPATRRAQKRRVAEIQARGGRMSTILTDNAGQPLGG